MEAYEETKVLEELIDAFSSTFSLREIASAYCKARRNPDLAAQFLYDGGKDLNNAAASVLVTSQCSTSSKSSCDGPNCADHKGSKASKPIKLRFSAGSGVSGVIGKGCATGKTPAWGPVSRIWPSLSETFSESFANWGARKNSKEDQMLREPSVAGKVLSEKHVIPGRTVEVQKAVPRGEHNNRHSQKGFNKSNGKNGLFWSTKKIFVGGLSPSLTEEEVKAYFRKFGRIRDVLVMSDTTTQRPMGYGFITFDRYEAVDNVMQKRFHEMKDKVVEVKRFESRYRSNSGRSGGYNMGSGGRAGSRSGGVQGSGINPPLRPGNGENCSGYSPQLSGYTSAGGYPCVACGYLGGHDMGAYGAVGEGGTPVVLPGIQYEMAKED